MRLCAWLLACLLASCGGSTEVGPAQTGGSGGSDAGGSDSSADASAQDSTTADTTLQCMADSSDFIWSMQQCHGANECQVVVHAADCCGTQSFIAVTSASLDAYGKCEKAWSDALPPCGCMAQAPTADDGQVVTDPKKVIAECTYWTQSGGICRTKVVL